MNGSQPYIIAEISANHNGDINNAFRLIELAKKHGANAVKIQTYTADTMTIECERPEFKISGGLWHGYSLYELYQQAHTPWEWHQALFEKAKKVGITLFSSPFDESAIDFLETLDAPAYKIASFEALDFSLIEYAAKTGKPLIISTGLASLEEIEKIHALMQKLKFKQYCLLHCISGYPTPIEQANVATLVDLQQRFNCVTGLSDHTLGNQAAMAATALGAAVIEKHFTFRRSDGGPDAAFSLEPDELEQLCTQAKLVFQAIGQVNYETKPAEQQNLQFRRSIYAVKNIAKGEAFTTHNVRRIRPGLGLPANHYKGLLSKTASQDIKVGTPLNWSLVNNHGE
ncbi:pseudaminic acid synthase [Motilimonas pumila]|uniref:Pseudaminic acid synthase n=1 Tax=Motilimonas pumila TaxID=2303987 RepID=A0A418YH23_9GAMM|nr:pseudaminic acid synthase [Motilimonas pumila]RJG49117.1 pseudaminic acid synthase [Motilimonas pumila]